MNDITIFSLNGCEDSFGVPAFRSDQGGKAALDMSQHVFNDDDLILDSNSWLEY